MINKNKCFPYNAPYPIPIQYNSPFPAVTIQIKFIYFYNFSQLSAYLHSHSSCPIFVAQAEAV